MGVESAEMTKHAVNGFLATSVAFINELASICEQVGADAAEVSRGLKSERRIGPRAYLSPGEAFAGGTLARDIGFLRELAAENDLPAHLFNGVAEGNAAHKRWTQRKLLELLGAGDDSLQNVTVAVWGLTYKPHTDTLRRSSAVELCHWLLSQGAEVRAHDPALSAHPRELDENVTLCDSPLVAVEGADALVLCTPWPEYRDISPERLLSAMAAPTVIDPTALLASALAAHPVFRYVRVGSAGRVETTGSQMAARS
jgi:UDPglucose 6-dehydrogenase